ncbi:Uncharacterised protein [Mycolicibacterium vanbaalenii]|uniref:Mycothiol-dependent maleylpyruvate isomerase metal-binding domain-containing protein n=1 Tax=Mycolicibacterium vanbaalenii TaxID=110539 RepID=A0A5S9QYF2_MYCVN|nr:TIGR03085 family metal-binding protein [Mycolicibacterium vanbaalenii]CAA0124504.1 Uncharacterised protein [Mycolicibacterium vanbaalenii]
MTVARDERAALLASMRAVGPDAPTLCAGWTVRDLAAHLLARENRIDYLPGIAIARFSNRTERIQADIRAYANWQAMLTRLSTGPPAYSPFKWLDSVASIHEMFVHHEDIRRVADGWTPREMSVPAQRALRRVTMVMSRVVLPRLPAQVTLRTRDLSVVSKIGRGPRVMVTADVGELLLFVFGRTQINADFEGDADTVDAITRAKRRV